jgi:hypothetical protein
MEFIYEPAGRGIVLHLYRRARLSRRPQESRERARCPRASDQQRARGGAPTPGRGGKGARRLPARAGRCGHGGDVVTEVDNITALAAKQAETLAAETCSSFTPTSASTAVCASRNAPWTPSSQTRSPASKSGSTSTANTRRFGRTSRERNLHRPMPTLLSACPTNSQSTSAPIPAKLTRPRPWGRRSLSL